MESDRKDAGSGDICKTQQEGYRLSDEIEQVRKQEERRGRRPIDDETREERRRQKAALKEILQFGTIADFEAAMLEYGISPDSAEWKAAIRIWNAERGRA
jgi:hypothetical protein